LHNTTCTYNAPCRRKRYAVNSSDLANQVNQEAEIKIKKLEEQLNAYKKRVQELEKSLTQYLSPIPAEAFTKKPIPLSYASQLIYAYEGSGYGVCSHFDLIYENLKSSSGSKETTWQLVSAYKKSYSEQYFKQCSTEGLLDILSWMNVFLYGEAMVDRTLVKEDLINLAISLITTLFFHRGIQFNPTLAYRTMAILVSLTNYLKLVLKMPAYMATMGFLMQLAQQYENSMDSSLLNVVYGALLVCSPDITSQEKWRSKFHSQPVQPPLTDIVRFQLYSLLTYLISSPAATEQELRSMIFALKQMDEELIRPLGRSQWYYFYRTWLLVIKAEFTIRLNEFDRYEYLMKHIQLNFAQLPTQLLKNRLAKIISAIGLICQGRGFYFKGGSFACLQSVPIQETDLYAANNNEVQISGDSPRSREEYSVASSVQSLHSPVIEESPRSLQEKFSYPENNYSSYSVKQM
jgi:hypothetical protein